MGAWSMNPAPDCILQNIFPGSPNWPLEPASEEFEDLMKAGIIDPTKVVRSALQNAASVASLLLTTECMVAEKPEDKGGNQPHMPPGGMM